MIRYPGAPTRKAVTRARALFESEIRKVARGVRSSLVVPICRRHGLEFISGNGSYSFYLGNSVVTELYLYGAAPNHRNVGVRPSDFSIDTKGGNRQIRLPGLSRVLWALRSEVEGSFELGCYVDDVRKGRDY